MYISKHFDTGSETHDASKNEVHSSKNRFTNNQPKLKSKVTFVFCHSVVFSSISLKWVSILYFGIFFHKFYTFAIISLF